MACGVYVAVLGLKPTSVGLSVEQAVVAAWQTAIYSLGPLGILDKLPEYLDREGYTKPRSSVSTMLGHKFMPGTQTTYMAIFTTPGLW